MGQPDDFVSKFLDQLAAIRANPHPHFIFVAIVAGGIWWLLGWRYDGIIANKDSTILSLTTQRDEYKDKLGGASPDQAKARIDELEKRLSQIEPRRVTKEQRTKLIARLSPPSSNALIEIVHDGACTDCNQYAADFSSILSEIGWKTLTPMALGIGGWKSPKGVTLVIYDNAPEGALLERALETASIPFDAKHQSKANQPAMTQLPNASLLITSRTVL